MKMTKARWILAAMAGAITAGAAWHLRTLKPPSQVLVGLDASISVAQKAPELRHAVAEYVDSKTGLREGSTLGVFIIGASVRNPEPEPAFSDKIPFPPDSVYGRDEAKFREERSAFFDQVEQALQDAKPRRNSPIYALVTRGVEHLQSLGCGSSLRCYYLVKTDLVEDAQPELRAAIEAAGHNPDVEAPQKLVGSIDNPLIEVHFCGTSDVTPRRETANAEAPPEARIRIWKQLFSHPELVSFAPFCGK